MEVINRLINIKGFEAKLTGYIMKNDTVFQKDRRRPAILILPGGGYQYTSVREAEPIALKFIGMGYQTFVLDYSCAPTGAKYPVALCQALTAMQLINENADEWFIDAGKTAIMGFSAGGHLAASVSCMYEDAGIISEMENAGVAANLKWIKPAACILGYPVITADEKYTHIGSIESLTGMSIGNVDKDFFSMEKKVSEKTPPTFLWHTWADGAVNVQNSLKYASALKEHGVTAELHIFPFGGHGLALANEETSHPDGHEIVDECQEWPVLADRFLKQVMR